MDRDVFLDRIRQSLTAPGPKPPAAPAPYRPPTPPSRDQRVEILCRELEQAGGVPHRVETLAAARDEVLKTLDQAGARRVIRGDTPSIRRLELDTALAERGIASKAASFSDRDDWRDTAFQADAGVTSVDFGIAETGTLALLTAPDQGRAISLLPPLHIAILEARDVVYELSALFQRTIERAGALPSALTFITGPSRTGDIEQKLTIGIHGPASLHLIVVG